MAENKTKPTSVAVSDFSVNVKNDAQRDDSFILVQMIKEITGDDPVLLGLVLSGLEITTTNITRGGITNI